MNIVDGHGTHYELNTDPASLAPDLKREREDVDRFFQHNFPNSQLMHQKFDEILFAKFQTDEKPVIVKIVGMAKTTEQKGTLHRIPVKITDVDEGQYSELRFVEVGGEVYWLPFGW